MNNRKKSWILCRIPLPLLFIIGLFFVIGLFVLSMSSVDPTLKFLVKSDASEIIRKQDFHGLGTGNKCATVEEMGEMFRRGYIEESMRVREIIRAHFENNGVARVRQFTPQQFCSHGFVLGKASEAGLGNELYKILTASALSVMLNRSLIIGQTRGAYPFADYVSYSNFSFTLKEVKHLWRKNGCLTKYGRHLTMRIDDFLKPRHTDVLCGNWKIWEEPIIWFQNTTDAVAAQFFLKNIHHEMRDVASSLFGKPEDIHYRANVFGELMKILISPSKEIDSAVNWALDGKEDPDITLHMRMMMNRSPSAKEAALVCIRKAIHNLQLPSKPRVVLVSDTPSLLAEIALSLAESAEVLYFDYENYNGYIASNANKSNNLNFRVKDWGPAPRWVAFVDFFLASRAKHTIISGAHRRVGTTYVQLIAALAAAYRLDENFSIITFLSSFQSNLLSGGLSNQIGWGHVWNRFAGPLSCHDQPNQCALTPLLPPAWWDGFWQSPIPRDVRKMEVYGIKLNDFGSFDSSHLNEFCSSRKRKLATVQFI